MNFRDKLEKAINKNNSLLCVGLDPELEKIPKRFFKSVEPLFEFNKSIIDATHDLVCSYKPNIAFYASSGLPGLKALIKTIAYIHLKYPEIPVILDAKRGDISPTAIHYAKEVFDVYKADAVTLNPYLGFDSIKPFLERKDKGIIILSRTSNPSASDFQDLEISSISLYLEVAKKVDYWNKTYKNCMLVVGATWPEELRKVRKLAPKMFFLVPGIGAQQGNLKKLLKNGLRSDKSGLIIHAGRSIIYASSKTNFASSARKEALKLKREINKYR